MSPYEIILLMNAHTQPGQPYDQRNAPIYDETMERLTKLGLFDGSKEFGYAPTDKLHAYCKIICMLPIPMQVWSIPPMSLTNVLVPNHE